MNPADIIYMDLETTGLNPRQDRISLASVNGMIFGEDEIDDLIRLIQEPDITLVGHNLKFDIGFLYARSGHRLSIANLFDTMIAHQLLTAGLETRSSLDNLTRYYLGINLDKTLQKSDWSGNLSQGQLEYAARDSLVLPSLHNLLSGLLQMHTLEKVAEIEFQAIPAISEMEVNGVGLNFEAARLLFENLMKRKLDLEAELIRLVESYGWKPQEKKKASKKGFNPRSNKDVVSAIQIIYGLNVDSCNHDNLELISREYPDIQFASALLEYRDIEKQRGMLEGWIEQAENGRLYPSYFQLGADTGRFTSSKPNIQQIPRDSRIKGLFHARSGYKLIECDFSGIELRIAATLSGDSGLIRIFREGLDPHKTTASGVFHKPIEGVTPTERQIAKSINFGSIYGGSWRILQKAIPGIEEKEARRYLRDFFRTYPGLAEWQDSCELCEKVEFGLQKYCMPRSLSGRYRFVEPKERNKLLNTPVQATGADLLKASLGALYNALCSPEYNDNRILTCIHDSIIIEVPEDRADEIGDLLRNIMVTTGNEMLFPTPCDAEIKIGNDWSFRETS
ncbi:MAG: hypothetical protein GYA29_00740 [Methanothrix sp.]|nr:hypothetical protein [Methanothrix sp.]